MYLFLSPVIDEQIPSNIIHCFDDYFSTLILSLASSLACRSFVRRLHSNIVSFFCKCISHHLLPLYCESSLSYIDRITLVL